MTKQLANILDVQGLDLSEEVFETLVTGNNTKVERIVSYGHSSEKDFWYEQDAHEWVLLLQGKALLLFEDDRQVQLNPGDYVLIPQGQKHRVEWTPENEKTIWLAIHFTD